MAHTMPKGLDDEATQHTAAMERRRQNKKKKTGGQRVPVKYVRMINVYCFTVATKSYKANLYRDWIKMKKERQRQQGKSVRRDSKYTGRKRKDKF